MPVDPQMVSDWWIEIACFFGGKKGGGRGGELLGLFRARVLTIKVRKF